VDRVDGGADFLVVPFGGHLQLAICKLQTDGIGALFGNDAPTRLTAASNCGAKIWLCSMGFPLG